MKILSIHADRISYKAKMKTRIAEPADEREDPMEQCMVFFSGSSLFPVGKQKTTENRIKR